MAIPQQLICQIVRKDRMVYQGPAAYVVLVTYEGELGIWPGHAPEIVAMGDGVLRIGKLDTDSSADKNSSIQQIVVRGGYAEVLPHGVLVLADHARDIDEIDIERTEQARIRAIKWRDELPKDYHARAYYEDKIAWCSLLLAQAKERNGCNPH